MLNADDTVAPSPLPSLIESMPTAELRTREVRPVALALRFLHRGGPLLVRAETLTAAADLLGELAAALPASVSASVLARSVVTDVASA